MKPTTKAQRLAMKQVFDRRRIYKDGKSSDQIAMAAGWTFSELPEHGWAWHHPRFTPMYRDSEDIVTDYRLALPISYLTFRRTINQGFDCLMVPWMGMWLGIEPDGYTHS